MKKITSLFLLLLACCIGFQACDNTKTYAEMLEDERRAVKNFIADNKIKVITVKEFEKDTITDLETNEYVLFPDGVYMQIVDRGSGDTIKNRDVITVRFMEYSIMEKDTVSANFDLPGWLDVFDYTVSGSTMYGQFRSGMLMSRYDSPQVPSGWLVPLRYIRDKARVKIIVPSKMGHNAAMKSVYPYYYDLRRIQIW